MQSDCGQCKTTRAKLKKAIADHEDKVTMLMKSVEDHKRLYAELEAEHTIVKAEVLLSAS